MYNHFSQDYDRFVNWTARLSFEMPHIIRLLGSVHAHHVLDAACGTGKHALELACHGFVVSGADLSEEMVKVARTHASEAGLNVRFESAGLGELEKTFGKNVFDAVLCLGNSLPHHLDPASLADTLQDFAACLRKGGLLLLQMRNFKPVLTIKQRFMEPQSYRSIDGEWIFLRFYDFMPSGLVQFNIITLKHQGEGSWQQDVNSTVLRPWVWPELQAALQKAEFKKVHSYGSMAGIDFEPESSGDLVIVASRA